MQKFIDVRIALREWLTTIPVMNLLLPYHLYLIMGGLGAMLLDGLTNLFRIYFELFGILSSVGYWAFLLGVLLTLITPNVKYLPYAFWGYVFIYLFPFSYFSFAMLIRVALFAYLGFLLLKFSSQEKSIEA